MAVDRPRRKRLTMSGEELSLAITLAELAMALLERQGADPAEVRQIERLADMWRRHLARPVQW